MKTRSLSLSLAFFAMLFWNLHCQSIPPCSFGGGTETGNVGMLACSHAIFEELASTSRQSPQTYLPKGEYQLNPILHSGSRAALAKTCVADTDTVIIAAKEKNTNILKYVYSVDTIICVALLTIRDTVTLDSIKNDTLDSSSKDVALILKKRIRDSYIIDYTIVLSRDTTFYPRKDSTFIKLTDSVNAPTKVVTGTAPGTMHVISGKPSINTDPVVIDSIKPDCIIIRIPSKAAPNNELGTGVIIPKTGYLLVNSSGFTNFIRELKPFGSTTRETEIYGFSDGSGLFSLTAPAPLSIRSLLSAKYTNDDTVCSLSVLFDPGNDRLFQSSADNRILSLDRRILIGNEPFEIITYSAPSADSAGGTAVLTRRQYPANGLMREASAGYYCLPGADRLDHRDNKVAKIVQSFSFRAPNFESLETELVFDVSSGTLQQFSDAKVTARMSYGMARVGTFEGRLDIKDGLLYGTYTENGDRYRCCYEFDIDGLFWEKIPER